ncbi:sulfatase-like hydrolase/transferase [Desulfoluna spongiiphila]|uniref:sulfatase-like hydrolase/transferase n=1 Tax=Desulfoluna spongiiphila TaxID=419481 RepID=UPI00125A170D|nr:sulfatase-like hydrolase/transferase [Desulfoluna spongiiphila]VVS92437.1 alkaline phosphatase-like alpha/beta/alpha [Desulfoluna spongiiphila]
MLFFVGLYVFSVLNIWTLKRIKFRRIRTFKLPGLSDLIASGLIAIYLAVAHSHVSASMITLLHLPAYLLLVILYIDAVVFQVYSAEVEPNSVRLFLSNFGIMKGDESARRYLLKERDFIFPVCMGLLYLTMALPQIVPYTASFAATATIMVASKCRIRVTSFVLMCTAYYLVRTQAHAHHLIPEPRNLSVAYAGGAAVLLFMEWLRYKIRHKFQHPFITQNTSFFGITGLYSEKIDTTLVITEEERQAIAPVSGPKQPSPSAMHGKFSGSNIILVSLESVAKSALDFYKPGGARTPVFNTLAKSAYLPENHSCICPNTCNSLSTMLNGNYENEITYPYVKAFNEMGYQSFFITPQNLFKETRSVITKSEYARIYSPKELAHRFEFSCDGWGADDPVIYDIAIDEFLDQYNSESPFFLHLLSNQTHINYTVFDTDKFCRFPNATPEGRYKNGIEESDFLVGKVLDRLKKAGHMENTIVVITGDHGESFGQLDYRSHSNAIIGEELNVPFLIHHPEIKETKWLSESNHFDLFPTLLDLVGMENIPSGCGDSLFSETRDNSFIAFSFTRKGRLPANFGCVSNGKKIMIDLILGRYWAMDHNDTVTENFSPHKRKVALRVLHDEMKKKGLVY